MLKLRKKSNNIHKKIFISLILVMIVTILILSTGLYMNFEKIVQSEIFASEKSSLSQVSYSVDTVVEYLKYLSLQIYVDKQLTSLIYYSNPDIEDIDKGLTKLAGIGNVMSFIQSIHIYNSLTGQFYSSGQAVKDKISDKNNYIDQDTLNIINTYKKSKLNVPIPRNIPLTYINSKLIRSPGYTYIFTETSKEISKIENAIIINLSKSWLEDKISQLGKDEKNNTLIMDDSGIVVVGSKRYPMLTDISNEQFANSLLHLDKSSGYFISKVESEKSLVIYYKLDSLNWILVRVIPYSSIAEKINLVKLKTIILCLFILIGGLVASLFMSKSLYNPINKLVMKLSSFEREKNDSEKQNLLKNIVLGGKTLKVSELKTQFDSLKVDLIPSKKCVLILVMIDQFLEFCNKYSLADRNLLKFAITNIASEKLSEDYVCAAIDTESDCITIILNAKDTQEIQLNDTFKELLKNIQELIRQYINLSVSMVVSSSEKDIFHIRELYEQVKSAAYYRYYYGHNCLVFYRDINDQKNIDFLNLVNKEKVLVEELLAGKVDHAKLVFNEILKGTEAFSLPMLIMLLTHIAFSMNIALETMKKNSGLNLDYNLNGLIADLNRIETIEEIDCLFTRLFDAISEEIKEKKNAKHDDLINRVIDYINKNYILKELSLEHIADIFEMSPAYLGRLFKKVTSLSIVDHISDVRMEKAKEMIISTNLNMNEIADRTGFTSLQYFYRVFKKTFGATPVELKQKIRQVEKT